MQQFLNTANFKESIGRAEILVLFLMLVTGIMQFRNYGISWDENTQRNSGIVFFNHIQQKVNLQLVYLPPFVPKLDDYRDKEFGAAFEVFIFALERSFGFHDYKEVFHFRHLMNFIFFWLGIIVFLSILRKHFSGNYLPIIGCLVLFLHPRIFAESFYNSKDIILMVFFIFSFRLFLLFNETWKIGHAFWLGLVSALTFNIRPSGIMIPILTVLIMLPAAIRFQLTENKWNRSISLLALVLVFILFTWLSNPFLWDDPIGKPLQIISKFLKYDVSYTAGNVLFLGNWLPTNSLPWFYLPLWIGITTPVVYLAFLFAGVAISLGKAVKWQRTDSKTRINFFILGWLVIPIGVAIFFRSTLYDGWRHFYFLWPVMVFFTIIGFEKLISLGRKNLSVKKVRAVQFVFFLIFLMAIGYNALYNYHWKGHQYCYFNVLAPAPAINFELDYWGLSYKDALEYLVRNNTSGTLRIEVLNLPGYLNSFLLDPYDRERLWYHYSLLENFSTRVRSFYPFSSEPKFLRPGETAKYYISNFRDTSSPEELRKYRAGERPYLNQEFSFRVDGLEIIGIYNLQP